MTLARFLGAFFALFSERTLMKYGTTRNLALLAGFALFSSLALAQAQKPAPSQAAGSPTQSMGAQPAGTNDARDGKEGKEQGKPMASAKHSRRGEDARHCLDLPSNTAIIKCAEAYL
jgi:hypothetical protein